MCRTSHDIQIMIYFALLKSKYIIQSVTRKITCHVMKTILFIRFLYVNFYLVILQQLGMYDFSSIIQYQKGVHHCIHLPFTLLPPQREPSPHQNSTCPAVLELQALFIPELLRIGNGIVDMPAAILGLVGIR